MWRCRRPTHVHAALLLSLWPHRSFGVFSREVAAPDSCFSMSIRAAPSPAVFKAHWQRGCWRLGLRSDWDLASPSSPFASLLSGAPGSGSQGPFFLVFALIWADSTLQELSEEAVARDPCLAKWHAGKPSFCPQSRWSVCPGVEFCVEVTSPQKVGGSPARALIPGSLLKMPLLLGPSPSV